MKLKYSLLKIFAIFAHLIIALPISTTNNELHLEINETTGEINQVKWKDSILSNGISNGFSLEDHAKSIYPTILT